MRHPLRLPVAAACIFVATGLGSVRAQQFQQVTTFPSSSIWTEGVECADVDNDGDLDVFIGDAPGYTSAGTPAQNRLYINTLIETGTPWAFVDESVARLGAHTSIAKGVTTGDVNGDGWVDVIFANAFSTQPPFLYINQGASNPGFFTFQTPAMSGLTTPISSGSAGLGDVDDDGDLDLVLTDAYNNGALRPLHLFFNNGAGFFTENAAALASPTRSSHMDVHLADVDNDWDIDVLGITLSSASPAHFLLRNSGVGTFTDSSSLIAVGSGNSYEAEIGDLDGDTDLDLFFVSISGFADGAVRNNQVPNGTLSFTNQAGLGGNDDNEISLFDYDNDGDYDVLIGSLATTEKFYRNDGNFVFVSQNAIIQTQSDSTLDCTVGDLNNDGRYDVITVQGESGASFNDKFYRNITGTADTLAPVVVATNAPGTAASGSGLVVKAKVRDQVLDDGVNYVTGSADYVVTTSVLADSVTINAGSFSPANLVVAPGTLVTFQNASGANQNVTSTTTPYTYASGTLANSASYQHVFIRPGTYNYTSTLGGFGGTVTVSGTASSVAATYMGGQQYRFRLDDAAGGAGVQLCYELRFRDWPGNQRVTEGACIPLTPTGTGYCFGDGSGTPCPCGNNAQAGSGTGCLTSLGQGGRLVATGSASLGSDTVVLHGSGMPSSSALYFQGTTQVAGGAGAVFGDGLRCAGGSVVRLETKTNVGGVSQYPDAGDLPVSVKGAIGSPGTRNYQVWFRNAAAFCQPETFNLTNGLSILWNL